jgi:hypothetical protein
VFEAALGSRRMHEETLWWSDDGRRTVVVKATQPLVAASVDTLLEDARVPLVEGESQIKAAQTFAAAARGLREAPQLVERWEVRLVP